MRDRTRLVTPIDSFDVSFILCLCVGLRPMCATHFCLSLWNKPSVISWCTQGWPGRNGLQAHPDPSFVAGAIHLGVRSYYRNTVRRWGFYSLCLKWYWSFTKRKVCLAPWWPNRTLFPWLLKWKICSVDLASKSETMEKTVKYMSSRFPASRFNPELNKRLGQPLGWLIWDFVIIRWDRRGNCWTGGWRTTDSNCCCYSIRGARLTHTGSAEGATTGDISKLRPWITASRFRSVSPIYLYRFL